MLREIGKLIFDIISCIIVCILPIYALVMVIQMSANPLIEMGCLISLGWIIYNIDKFMSKIKKDIIRIKGLYEELSD